MPFSNRIEVALDKALLEGLLRGLYSGAKRKALKAVVGKDRNIYVESKDMRMSISCDETGKGVKEITIYNDKHEARASAEELKSFGLDHLAADTMREIKEQYNPLSHTLADGIRAFVRTYAGD